MALQILWGKTVLQSPNPMNCMLPYSFSVVLLLLFLTSLLSFPLSYFDFPVLVSHAYIKKLLQKRSLLVLRLVAFGTGL